MERNCAVIVAAGKGTRIGGNISKQFIEICEKPVLYYTLNAFSKSELISEIYLVLSKEHIDYCKENIIDRYKFNKKIVIVEGGAERQQSVYNGLKAIGQCDVVLIHDGARPFVSDEIIREGIDKAKQYGACACGVTPKDTIKIKDSLGYSIDTPERNTLYAVQTPQCFNYKTIVECHEKIKEMGVSVTDDTMVVERFGHKVFLFAGDYKNIKITTPEDIILAEGMLKSMKENK
jgi:2-C-methyl-D-erythritol 4-phosphate cytidylyltransferase